MIQIKKNDDNDDKQDKNKILIQQKDKKQQK